MASQTSDLLLLLGLLRTTGLAILSPTEKCRDGEGVYQLLVIQVCPGTLAVTSK